MQVLICYTETATGEDYDFQTEMEAITLENIIKAINNQPNAEQGPQDKLTGKALIKDAKQETYAFILSADEAEYFGSFLLLGKLYTRFTPR